jgi:methionine-rich copper-binding protein CopC
VEKRTDEGIVCFFDILGYKNILNNNKIDDCINIIKNILFSLASEAKTEMLKIMSNKMNFDSGLDINDFYDNHINTIYISDSILFFIDFDNMNMIKKLQSIFYSLILIIFFQKNSFENGFPMRACFDVGQFYYCENVFAGKAIVNSYVETGKLNFSGLVFTDFAYQYIKKIMSCALETIDIDMREKDHGIKLTFEILQMLIKHYIIPMKNGIEEKKYILNWWIQNDKQELRQHIFNVFHMHNKDVDNSVIEKINNTEKIIRYLIFQNELSAK